MVSFRCGVLGFGTIIGAGDFVPVGHLGAGRDGAN
jgi:hypothetical protein